jgi:hypothetical protein
MSSLPIDSKARKDIPMCRGLLDYFPDACAAVAELSFLANAKHNPGQEMHWSKDKSADHADCVVRHLVDRGKFDEVTPGNFVRHTTEVAWRALALLQTEIEEDRERLTRPTLPPRSLELLIHPVE